MFGDTFCKVPTMLMEAVGYVDKDGEFVKFTDTDRWVIAYMLQKIEFYKDKLKSECFESQSTIASGIGREYQSVGDSVRKLRDKGVLNGEVKVRPGTGGKGSWCYYGIMPTTLWKGRITKPEILEESDYCLKSASEEKVEKFTKANVVNKPYKYEPSQEDEEGSPF